MYYINLAGQYLLLAMFLITYGCIEKPQKTPKNKPNVLMICVDDMNDWTKLHDPSNPIHVPNIERLAETGTFFTQAYCNAPACNPSRASILSGVRPSTIGVYTNSSNWKDALSPDMLMPAHFKKHGYKTFCSGKIFHHHGPAHVDYSIFSESNPFPVNGRPDSPMPETNICGVTKWIGQDDNNTRDISPNFDWGIWAQDGSKHIDERTVDWAINKIKSESEPFFMAVGIFRPHMPFYVPESAFLDNYPLEELTVPIINKNDFDDLEQSSIDFIQGYGRYGWMSTFEHEKQRDPDIYEKAVQHYQASCSYADHNVGRLLDALYASGNADNTIIVLWSDHGYHLGEKEHWEKFILTEKSTHIPYIIVVPGEEKNRSISYPVSLVDLYPTLAELCGIPIPDYTEGQSLVPILEGKVNRLDKPVVITYGKNNHAIRADDFRYIRLADGTEELYNTTQDKHEWENLARNDSYRSLINSLAIWLPEINKEPVAKANNSSHSHHGDHTKK
ncbi:MAG: sulfatase [Cytophagales bacterium]|nr:sulfatase [Cytophagales bacterium]